MKEKLKRYAKMIKDLIYSFAAYALPTVVLQFAVQPLVAAMTGAEENGLFLSLYNAVKLCVSVLIVPLANVRLLDKKACGENESYNKGYNALFLMVTACALAAMVGFSLVYRGASADLWDYIRLFAVVILLCAHDFYAIAFRLDINYKNILLDNSLIVIGYGVGLFLFRFLGNWEYIFISGYAFGLAFVLIKSKIWRTGFQMKKVKRVMPQYSQLCASSGLNSATVYCDRLLIHPMLGGAAVSVYNAAAVVSKVISVVSAPVRNVLLSYIVDKDRLTLPKKNVKKLLLVGGVGVVGIYLCFYLASLVLCRFLYPQYAAEALRYVPLILWAMIMETASNILNVALLRFSKSSVQVLVSGVKIGVYVGCVLLLTGLLKMGLWGFCIAIFLADGAKFVLVLYHFIKNLKEDNKKLEESTNV